MQNKPETVLPKDFDGVVRFTNWTDEDFTGVWDKKEYRFPAKSRSTLVVPDATPLETINISRKFAKDLAAREFFRSQKYEFLRAREGERNAVGMIQPTGFGMSHAATYTDKDLEEMIERSLQPLEAGIAVGKELPAVKLEEVMHKDEDGNLSTAAIKSEKDLERLAKGE